MKNHALQDGRNCEKMAEDVCTYLGYAVTRPQSRTAPWDLLVNGLRVQVKKRSTVNRRGNTIQLRSSANKIAYFPGQIDVFVFLFDGEWFVLPANAISNACGYIRNNISPRELNQFRNAWSVLSGNDPRTERQIGLGFSKEETHGR